MQIWKVLHIQTIAPKRPILMNELPRFQSLISKRLIGKGRVIVNIPWKSLRSWDSSMWRVPPCIPNKLDNRGWTVYLTAIPQFIGTSTDIFIGVASRVDHYGGMNEEEQWTFRCGRQMTHAKTLVAIYWLPGMKPTWPTTRFIVDE